MKIHKLPQKGPPLTLSWCRSSGAQTRIVGQQINILPPPAPPALPALRRGVDRAWAGPPGGRPNTLQNKVHPPQNVPQDCSLL